MLKSLCLNNRLSAMVMGSAFWKGGSHEVARPIAIIQLKMEDACILCNVIEIFWWKKVTKTKRGGPSGPLKFHMAWYNCVKTYQFFCLNIQTPQLWKGRNDHWGVSHDNSFLWLEVFRRQQIFKLHKIDEVNPLLLDW
jgi:hypothetical protein